MQVAGRGTCLGVPIGPSAGAEFWTQATLNLRKVTLHISGLHATLGDRGLHATPGDRARAYIIVGQSIPGYLLQHRRLDAALIRADRPAISIINDCAHASHEHWVVTSCAIFGWADPGTRTWHAEAAAVQCALRHPHVAHHLGAITAFADSGEALLAPRHIDWRRVTCLSRMRAAVCQANGLPWRVREASALQSALQRHLERSRAAGDLSSWLRRRASSMWGYVPSDGNFVCFSSDFACFFVYFLTLWCLPR